MSISVMSWVFAHSETTKGDRLVLLALADYAHDDGTKAFPAVETLALKARLSERAVRYALRALEETGAIEQTGETHKGLRVYSILMRGGAQSAGGHKRANQGPKSAPDPPVEPPDCQGENARAPALRVSGKPVNRGVWKKTEAALLIFNTQAGTKLKALTGAGGPSESAKRIYLRILDWPELTLDQHRDIIERALASRWWGEGAPSVGVVYGPKVFEENMTRQPSAQQSREAGRKERAQRGIAAIKRIIDGKESE